MSKTLQELLEVKNISNAEADLYIYGDIVSDSWQAWGDEDTWPSAVKDFLKGVDGKNLNIYINSGGGSVFAGMAIYSMLKRHNGKKTVHIDGVAASIASVIALAGDEVFIPKNAYFMIHKPHIFTQGNSDELRTSANFLDKIEDGCVEIYKEHAVENFSEEQIRAALSAETWYTGAEVANLFTNIRVTNELEAVACISNAFENSKKVPHVLNRKKEQAEDACFYFDF